MHGICLLPSRCCASSQVAGALSLSAPLSLSGARSMRSVFFSCADQLSYTEEFESSLLQHLLQEFGLLAQLIDVGDQLSDEIDCAEKHVGL
eukprot:7386166-Prymnesium_polylepis.3